MKSGFLSENYCTTLSDYNRAANKAKTLRKKEYEMHEHRVYASRKSGAERKMLIGLVVLRDECDEREEI